VDQDKITYDRLSGTYSNHLRVGWNAFEFLLQFGQFRENDAEAMSVNSIVTSPAFAKAFFQTLRDSIAGYEKQFGEIPDVDRPMNP
jgi:hypothetical protein